MMDTLAANGDATLVVETVKIVFMELVTVQFFCMILFMSLF